MGAFQEKESRPELAPGQAGWAALPSRGQEHAERGVHLQVRCWADKGQRGEDWRSRGWGWRGDEKDGKEGGKDTGFP